MSEIRDVAEPLHVSAAGPVDATLYYNAGIDALVDAVEQLDYVLIPRVVVDTALPGFKLSMAAMQERIDAMVATRVEARRIGAIGYRQRWMIGGPRHLSTEPRSLAKQQSEDYFEMGGSMVLTRHPRHRKDTA